jgi:hypothetical protein
MFYLRKWKDTNESVCQRDAFVNMLLIKQDLNYKVNTDSTIKRIEKFVG